MRCVHSRWCTRRSCFDCAYVPWTGRCNTISSEWQMGHPIFTRHLLTRIPKATPRPHTAPISSLRNSLHDIGRIIRSGGLPKSIGPFVICVTGYVFVGSFSWISPHGCFSAGQVSNGALSLLNELPVKYITKDELPGLVLDPSEFTSRSEWTQKSNALFPRYPSQSGMVDMPITWYYSKPFYVDIPPACNPGSLSREQGDRCCYTRRLLCKPRELRVKVPSNG